MKNWKSLITYLGVVVFAVLFLFIGNRIASAGAYVFADDSGALTVEARVVRIVDVAEDAEWGRVVVVTFEAEIAAGDFKGEILTAVQTLEDLFGDHYKQVDVGDRVILVSFEPFEWFFVDYVRINYVVYLGVVFVILLLLFGRVKGLNAILTLAFTCSAVFAVFIPSILSGRNIYISTIVVCLYSIIVTIFIINGVSKKSLAAITGCFGGVLAAAVTTLVMNFSMQLTGIVSEDSIYLLYLPLENPIDLQAIIFAGIIIGASGAVMDVAISISSALWELRENAPDLTFVSIFKSGVNIGRDVMASMTNTLVLAYLGSSLSMILLLIVHVGSLTDLFNSELVLVELLQAIIGSLGILLTMPLTALVCAALFSRKGAAPGAETAEDESLTSRENVVE